MTGTGAAAGAGDRWVLALDSAGRVTTLALGVLQDESLNVVQTVEHAPRRAAAELVRGIAGVLDGRAPGALAAIVAVRGPGSFTGMRAGLSAAKALAEAASLPIIGVSRLAVLAWLGGAQGAALDAGRGQAYLRRADGQEQLLPLAELQKAAGEASLAVCDDRLASLFPDARRTDEPTAAEALRFSVDRLLAGRWDDPAELDALYLWREEQMLTGQPR